MKLGLVYPQTEFGSDLGLVREFAVRAEELGYEQIVVYEHVLGADPAVHELSGPYTWETEFHEPFVLFGYLAAITRTVELVTGILVLPQRPTALVAKQAATLDFVSGGRLILGVGVGWNQVEYAALGQDFHRRGARMAEQIPLLRQLWSEPLLNFEGEFDRIPAAGIAPRPARAIPIWMGGWADSPCWSAPDGSPMVGLLRRRQSQALAGRGSNPHLRKTCAAASPSSIKPPWLPAVAPMTSMSPCSSA